MAGRHMRLSYNTAGLLVEDLGSINGVYRRISQPIELIDGMRFRIHSMNFAPADFNQSSTELESSFTQISGVPRSRAKQ